MSWSDEAREWAKNEFKNGASASEISARLRVKFPTHPHKSRNAVIGITNRGGLRRADRLVKNSREQNRRRVQKQREKRASRLSERLNGAVVEVIKSGQPDPAVLAVIAEMDAADNSPRMPILVRDARGELSANDKLTDAVCRWPRGNPRDLDTFGFCGATAVPGLPYCECHVTKAFQPRQDKRRQADAPAVRQEGPGVETPASGQRRETEGVS